jgi:hypothetical protein
MTQPGEDLHDPDVSLAEVADAAGHDPEAPIDDAFEQSIPSEPARVPADFRLPLDANEADAYDQSQVVDLDDEY